MILAIVFLLVIAVGIFFALKNKSIKIRFLSALLFFLLGASGLIAFILKVGDHPPAGAIPITDEVLKKEGMTEKEWNAYIEKRK